MDDRPPIVVAEFLASLPETIRKQTGTLVFILALGRFPEGEADPLSDLVNELQGSAGDWPIGFSLLVRVVGAVDYFLFERVATADSRKERLRYVADRAPHIPMIEESALMAPLSGKHYQRAASDWRTLREGSLSAPSLVHWELGLREGPRQPRGT